MEPRGTVLECERTTGNLNVDDLTTLLEMPQHIDRTHLTGWACQRREYAQVARDFFRDPEVANRHLQKLVRRVAVSPDCCMIDRKNGPVPRVEHPHWIGISLEEHSVLFRAPDQGRLGFPLFVPG